MPAHPRRATPSLLLLAACAASQLPVPVIGPAGDVAALAGEWAGDYSSAESGRSGSISFTLRAAGDSAFGDVVMVPAAWGRPLVPWRQENAESPAARSTPTPIRRPVRGC